MPFMAPELLAPSRYGLKVSVPTQKADVYAFGLVVFQVIALYHHNLLVFLDIQPGPDGRATVSGLQAPRTPILCLARCPSKETPKCKGNRNFQLLVVAHGNVLE